MTPTLALERLMLHPDFERLIAQARQSPPTALTDQLDAATRDASTVTDLVAACAGDYAPGASAPRDLPGWLRLGLLDTLVQWAEGKASTCRHSPSPHRPEPVLAAAWKPGVVSCVRCAHLWATSRAANRTCDSCGRLCAGPDRGDGVYPGMLRFGALIFQYGTCGDCRPSTASGNGLSATLPAEQDAPGGTGRAKPRGGRGRRRGKGGRR